MLSNSGYVMSGASQTRGGGARGAAHVIPPAAVEVQDETATAGGGARYRCEVEGVLVGYRLRDETGS